MFFKACTTANEGNPSGRFSSRHSRGPALTVFNSFALATSATRIAQSLSISALIFGVGTGKFCGERVHLLSEFVVFLLFLHRRSLLFTFAVLGQRYTIVTEFKIWREFF